jgi:hypothetical protein
MGHLFSILPAGLRFAAVFGGAAFLFACQSAPKIPEAPAPVVVEPIVQPQAEVTPQQKIISGLLSEADYCLSQNRLLNPISDNAHDRYRSVLLMEPENERAKLGLQTIALRYVELAREAARRGNVSEAQSMIRYAKGIDNNPLVQEAAETLRKQVINMPAPKPYQAGPGELVLETKLLQAKDPQIKNQLLDVAQKAKQNDEFVLIVARSDAEGRWIYQQLRNAVPGYLVRGDIRIGAPARVRLVKTLE